MWDGRIAYDIAQKVAHNTNKYGYALFSLSHLLLYEASVIL